jgi:hypothetical protein
MQQDAPVTSSPTSAIEEAKSATSGLNWPLLTSDACFPAAEAKPADLATLTAELVAALRICSQVGRPAAAWSGYNVWDVRRGSTRWGSSSGDPMEDNHNTG